ncbi:MAG: tRNA-specific adenosine deaminase [Elusimicrobia bacterium RIFCSPLOWO2_02_FULL_39_32]|nr:MAG: tRNA-specific adenosine deaminase [Elusimicrobia bacterium GWA2_38_7]OGR81563.1 MAG: tRNA-specific adenosine deaminase [Elusimicrobia bacterium RIFCSPHIGHO2_02_FULL_39_36]OGR91607.1 MAG: tRNA-specific adenosine deaminase [Elusimicrobia bacterium RIFCSPLOWO2_02_FULL_39_32]OGR98834.1 MAG: tRNA-specific adenosine deaminase [Elusimicrobia bacterium RIFCSPLOWO2_12_FULL_39_28]
MAQDCFWMQQALEEAKKAGIKGEVPIGAVLVKNNKKIASAHNLTIAKNDPTAHAEILCLRRASKRLKNVRLTGTILYVTVEPCALCAGALIWSRIKKVIFGCWDIKSGACGSVVNLSQIKQFNHHFQCEGGILEKDSAKLLQDFFKDKR